ncbi:hypothetical protein NESM_000113500 [Novymonas esmeraldas]|uniref:Calponin-homology (CH) domain-containing protein n=1 Tax=Novymonas esmeraldas TaxID=1808958 RepID=A0AAW0F549_9TRYP
MSVSFTEQDRADLREIFRIFDFSKVEKVDETVAQAEKAGRPPATVFDDLYRLFKIEKLPDRDEAAKRLHLAVSDATSADVESALRRSEMRGFTERDAVRSLERKFSVQRLDPRVSQASRNHLSSPRFNSIEEPSELLRTSSSLRHVTVNEMSLTSNTAMGACGAGAEGTPEVSLVLLRPASKLSAAPTRENLDEIMGEEVREWVARMVGSRYNADVLAMPNFIDALRSGVVLHVLLQKMEDPPVADDHLKLPKRTTGFFVRDNVATFLATAKKRYGLVDAQLFTDSDLVDGKSDRQVVTCLMAIARIAYCAGTIKTAPSIIMYDHEIEQQQNRLSHTDLDRIVEEAEADEELPALAKHHDSPPASVGTSPTAPQSGNESRAPDTPPASHDTAEVQQTAPTQEEHVADPEAVDGEKPHSTPTAANSSERHQSHHSLSSRTSSAVVDSADVAASPASPSQVSPPPADQRTRSPSIIEKVVDVSEVPPQPPREEPTVTPRDSPRDAAPPSAQRSPTPASEAPATAEDGDVGVAPPPPEAAKDVGNTSSAEAAAEERRGSGDSGGRVFYLRDGMLRNAKPTPKEEREFEEHRKKAGPRVVWKHPSSPLAATTAPRYHSRHWDGIDVALGRHLNEHYTRHPASPWRFRMVATTAGEYVLYNRLSAHKRVVYLRIIQANLFLRNAGKLQSWVDIDESLEALEKQEP